MKEKNRNKSNNEKEFEEEVFKRLPEWCKGILKLSPKYKHLNNSDSFQSGNKSNK